MRKLVFVLIGLAAGVAAALYVSAQQQLASGSDPGGGPADGSEG